MVKINIIKILILIKKIVFFRYKDNYLPKIIPIVIKLNNNKIKKVN